jgi:hypothetical protein
MGTRGAYGFRIGNQDKITYCHFDSYPDFLGRNLLEYVADTPTEMMKEVASAIIMVDLESKPAPELVKRYSKFGDLNVSNHTFEDWYCLLRKTQGDLYPYNNDLRHMIDFHDFPHDSLFCEWAYIINLDTELFEAYKGLNKDSSAKGRYARYSTDDNHGYRGVVLIDEIPLADIRPESIEDLVRRIENLARLRKRVA